MSGDTHYYYRVAQEYLITNLVTELSRCEDRSIRLEFEKSSNDLGVKYLNLNVWLKDN